MIHIENKNPVDMCSCANCGGCFKISDCDIQEESEGWEYPSYLIHLCPACPDGGLIEDYYHLEDIAP